VQQVVTSWNRKIGRYKLEPILDSRPKWGLPTTLLGTLAEISGTEFRKLYLAIQNWRTALASAEFGAYKIEMSRLGKLLLKTSLLLVVPCS